MNSGPDDADAPKNAPDPSANALEIPIDEQVTGRKKRAADEPREPSQTERILGDFWKKTEASRIRAQLLRERDADRSGPRIPKLSPRSAPRYIAAVALAVKLKQLDPKQANAMLYAAQLLIAASRMELPKTPARKLKPPGEGTVLEG